MHVHANTPPNAHRISELISALAVAYKQRAYYGPFSPHQIQSSSKLNFLLWHWAVIGILLTGVSAGGSLTTGEGSRAVTTVLAVIGVRAVRQCWQ